MFTCFETMAHFCRFKLADKSTLIFTALRFAFVYAIIAYIGELHAHKLLLYGANVLIAYSSGMIKE